MRQSYSLLRSLICTLFLFSALGILAAQSAAIARPAITGVSHISVYARDAARTNHFYVDVLGCAKAPDPENATGTRYYFNPTQFVEVLPLPAGNSANRLDHIGFATDNAAELRAYLLADHVRSVHGRSIGPIKKGSDGSRWFRVKDPENNTVEFVEGPTHPPVLGSYHPIGRRMIHVGMVVHSRAAEEHFYKDILGFRPYWYGGMKPGKLDWVSLQVPNGQDWIEFMLTSTSENMSQNDLGVLNHFSLGVPSMANAVATLKRANRMSSRHDGPEIGRDGKWQFNLYDPDGTRVELMEFKNVRPPCCSAFTAPNPSE